VGHLYEGLFTPEPGHLVSFVIGANVPAKAQCGPTTKTIGPTPMSDQFQTSCWYIGGLKDCTFGQYDEKMETSVLLYKGVPSKEATPITRDMSISLHCDMNETGFGTARCTKKEEKSTTHFVFECEVHTEHACLGPSPFPWLYVLYGCLGVGAIVLGIVLLIALIILVILLSLFCCGKREEEKQPLIPKKKEARYSQNYPFNRYSQSNTEYSHIKVTGTKNLLPDDEEAADSGVSVDASVQRV